MTSPKVVSDSSTVRASPVCEHLSEEIMPYDCAYNTPLHYSLFRGFLINRLAFFRVEFRAVTFNFRGKNRKIHLAVNLLN